MIEWCDKQNFERLPSGFEADQELKDLVGEMDWQKRAAFIELAKGDVYKHMFYAAKNSSSAKSATEGAEKGKVGLSTIICRYDRFVDVMSVLPEDAARRALEEPVDLKQVRLYPQRPSPEFGSIELCICLHILQPDTPRNAEDNVSR